MTRRGEREREREKERERERERERDAVDPARAEDARGRAVAGVLSGSEHSTLHPLALRQGWCGAVRVILLGPSALNP